MKYLKSRVIENILAESKKYEIGEDELRFSLKNIRTNGATSGCSGHVWLGKACVYLNTEKSRYEPLSNLCFVRYAKNEKDNSLIAKGNANRFVKDSDLAAMVLEMLKKKKEQLENEENSKKS